VPVGEDQRQHLELCRDLAGRFNQKYSETFTIPEPFVPQTGARIMSLADPTRKMSKSDNNQKATVFILDEPEQIKKKVGSSVTDSGSEIKAGADKPGVSNLLTIHSSLSGKNIASLEDHFLGKGYGVLKSEVTELLVENLRPVRESYRELISNKSFLDTVLKEGAQAAQKRAFKILSKVQRKIGLPDRPR
jgi:tryptophanyl-tRNA synthetase